MKLVNNRNTMGIKFTALGMLCCSALVLGARVPAIEGIYAGEMKLKLGKISRVVPLQLAMTTTGESVVVQIAPGVNEERLVIDGAFLVDDEGGPYGVGHVTYNLDLGELDLRYNRRDETLGQVPSSFRLDGKVDAQGNMLGRVISGLQGVIGTFQLKRSTLTTLKVTTKYQGVWAGEGRTPQGYNVPLEIGLGTSERPQVNPPNYEFYYTPGKLGYVSWKGTKAPFNQIAVDYLRRSIVMSDTGSIESGAIATAECHIDDATQDLIGTLYGVYRGKVASFRLKKRQ
jgi:hypothetical protein